MVLKSHGHGIGFVPAALNCHFYGWLSFNKIWDSPMKTVNLASGMGTRLAEETDDRPKPMGEIGGRPILWRIMKVYSLERDVA